MASSLLPTFGGSSNDPFSSDRRPFGTLASGARAAHCAGSSPQRRAWMPAGENRMWHDGSVAWWNGRGMMRGGTSLGCSAVRSLFTHFGRQRLRLFAERPNRLIGKQLRRGPSRGRDQVVANSVPDTQPITLSHVGSYRETNRRRRPGVRRVRSISTERKPIAKSYRLPHRPGRRWSAYPSAHSMRRAIRGSTFAARRAGNTAAVSPASASTATAPA